MTLADEIAYLDRLFRRINARNVRRWQESFEDFTEKPLTDSPKPLTVFLSTHLDGTKPPLPSPPTEPL